MTEERVQRRLAAILAADVVGYSRLMAADEAGTLERLKAIRRDLFDLHIAEHRGRIVKLMGDGALVEFGSVVDAVRCAVAIQRDVTRHGASLPDAQRIALRIGVNLGDVIVEGDDIYGDGVNIAARLQELADPGGICVSGTVLEHIGNRADISFDDRGEQRVKNIDRPLRVYRVRQHVGEPPTSPPAAALGHAQRSASIAVLPFANMSGDPSQEYFSDGITEDIITELTRFRSLFVIARNSSFAFKGSAVDIREIGRKLGVRYVVEGSIRRAGNRIRITAQLIDAAGGNHMWAERYDRELADIFDVQDEVTRQIVTNIAPRLEIAGHLSAKRQRPEDMRAYDYYLQAKPLLDAPVDFADLARGRDYCNRALEIDPNYARAYAYLAASYIVGITMMEVDDPAEWQARALASAERAVALDDLDSFCQHTLGESAFTCLQPERGLRHIRKAIAINPHDADILALASYIEIAAGDPRVGLQHVDMAMERNPTNPPMYHWLKGTDLAMLGRYDEALAEFDQFGPPNPSILKLRAVALVQLGRLEEAR
ncbi:MAG TPA: adenylate/guanylate cyclase domain-containing protein, partial [Burkholderiales bacterium]|nr:adenylate/guanylate cyclase domain-containing protein [Burkholderiales bacterium]